MAKKVKGKTKRVKIDVSKDDMCSLMDEVEKHLIGCELALDEWKCSKKKAFRIYDLKNAIAELHLALSSIVKVAREFK